VFADCIEVSVILQIYHPGTCVGFEVRALLKEAGPGTSQVEDSLSLYYISWNTADY